MFSFLEDAINRCSREIQKLGDSIVCNRKEAPANAEQVARVATRFGGAVPPELLQLGRFANSLEFVWTIEVPEGSKLPGIAFPWGRLAWDFGSPRPLDPRDNGGT